VPTVPVPEVSFLLPSSVSRPAFAAEVTSAE